MSAQSSTHHACVFTPTAVHYGNGTMTPLKPGVHADLVAILDGTLLRFDKHATVILDGVPLGVVEFGAARLKPESGWLWSKVGPWTLFHRADGRTVAVGCRSAMGPRHFGVLVGPDTDPGTLAVLLDRYKRATGMSWRGTCATTALNAIRLSWENVQYQPRWNFPKTGPGYATGPLIWSREPTDTEKWWNLVHTFDATAAYLGAAGNAVLAWSVLEHSGVRPFDAKVPGYWHVRLDPATIALDADPLRPPLLPVGRVVDGAVWLTTPYVQLLGELGDPIDVVDSWTGAGGRRDPGFRVLRKWAEQMRDARASVLAGPAGMMRDTLAYAVKRTYKDATGGMQREGMRVYRPDWAHTFIDLWRATVYRRILRVRAEQGVWPVAVKTDSISYADSTMPQPRGHGGAFPTLTETLAVASCEVPLCRCSPPSDGGRLGTYRHETTTSVEVWTAVRARKVGAR